MSDLDWRNLPFVLTYNDEKVLIHRYLHQAKADGQKEESVRCAMRLLNLALTEAKSLTDDNFIKEWLRHTLSQLNERV